MCKFVYGVGSGEWRKFFLLLLMGGEFSPSFLIAGDTF